MSIAAGLGLGQPFGGAAPFEPSATVALDFATNRYRVGAGRHYTSDFASLSGLTVTRASVGYVEDGESPNITLRQLAANVARIGQGRGLLVEEARTNLLLRSQEFDTAGAWSWVTSSTTANTTTAPDGTLTADTLTLSANSGFVYQGFTATSGQAYTASVYLKAGTGWAKVALYNPSAGHAGTYVNLSTGALGSTFVAAPWTLTSRTITPLANGWYRVAVTATVDTTGPRIWIEPSGGDRDGLNGETVIAWGAQVEHASFPTSYTPTTTASATRASDADDLGGQSLPANDFDVDATWTNSGTPPATIRPWEYHDGTENNRLFIQQTSAGVVSAFVVNGGVSTQIGSNSAALTGARDVAVSIRRRSGNWQFFVDGTQVGSDTAASKPTITTLGLGRRRTTAEFLNTYLKRLVVMPR